MVLKYMLITGCLVTSASTVTVLKPFSLRGTMTSSHATFGASFIGTRPTVGKAVQAQPYAGCTELANRQEMKGAICLVERGGCSFVAMATNCYLAGASGVMIIDNSTDTTHITLTGTTSLPLPKTVMVPRYSGQAILREITHGEQVVVSIGLDMRPVKG
eukprot:TRINITY_DN20106_c0_g1_i1.p1 TRINITY_DN20106_c0_g1~~TRINITY_DN20106_c0_g1_i1.p1  ORF type:complete len:184 (+),score=25.20 TRINITY_DN20106_c0_g1_i1:78-554(+)